VLPTLRAWLSGQPGGFTLWTHQPNAQARAFYEREGLEAVEFTDGSASEEKVPDVRYEWRPRADLRPAPEVQGC
jgi:hypothetical protein